MHLDGAPRRRQPTAHLARTHHAAAGDYDGGLTSGDQLSPTYNATANSPDVRSFVQHLSRVHHGLDHHPRACLPALRGGGGRERVEFVVWRAGTRRDGAGAARARGGEPLAGVAGCVAGCCGGRLGDDSAARCVARGACK